MKIGNIMYGYEKMRGKACTTIEVKRRRRRRTPPPRRRRRQRRNDVVQDPAMIFSILVSSVCIFWGMNLFLSSPSFVRKCNSITAIVKDHFEIKVILLTIQHVCRVIGQLIMYYSEETISKMYRYFQDKEDDKSFDFRREERCVYLQSVYMAVKSIQTFMPHFVSVTVIDGFSAYRCHESLQEKTILFALIKFWCYLFAVLVTFLASLSWIWALILAPFSLLKLVVFLVYCTTSLVLSNVL